MPRTYRYKTLLRKKIERPHEIFLFLFLRFGFTINQLTIVWQSEVVQMAFRNYMRGVTDQDTLYIIIYSWLRNNKNEYTSKPLQLHVYQLMRFDGDDVESSFYEIQTNL